jgi:hypothetical protein
VRDEADIILQSIRYALTWADAIYTYDTGSTDGTWELLQQMSREDARLVLYRREPVYFRNDLRAVLFNEYRKHAKAGDWFATVDADEFYHISPPEFVNTQLRNCETAVSYQLYDFKLTSQEAGRLQDSSAISAERKMSIENRRRHYIPLRYAEPRLFKYRPTMQWVPPKAPYNLGFMARERIPIRHYSNRDPSQMESKYRLRLPMRPYVGHSASPHWDVNDWRSLLINASDSELQYWQVGQELPTYHWRNHLARPYKRGLQQLVHFGLLPVLDRLRPRFPVGYQADRISPEINRQLITTPRQAALGDMEKASPRV